MAHNTIIGKDLLDQLMFSLYPEAETIYREYLQNACDSIKEAVEIGLLSNNEEGHVSINIDKFHATIVIEDNGVGISSSEAEKTLKDIACSKKQKESYAGFFGIGRLVGAGYCKTLCFKTSISGEKVASEIEFNVDKIRKFLQDDNNNFSAAEVIDNVTIFKNTIPEDNEKHYFIVTMKDVLPEYSEVLLDEEKIYHYLVQVAPISYMPEFKNNLILPSIREQDSCFLEYYNNLEMIQVSLNDIVNIRKQYGLTISGTSDEIDKLRYFFIKDIKYGVLAWGWYAITPFSKAIPDIDPITNSSVLTRGIRLRSHNIQIGGENFFNGIDYFKQARSNNYFNGEIHIINSNIKPTTDRANLSPSKETLRLKELIAEFFNTELQKVYQTANKVKKEYERIKEAEIAKCEIEQNSPKADNKSKIEEVIKKKNIAENEFKKYQDKKEKLPNGLQSVLDIYERKYNNFRKDIENNINIGEGSSKQNIKKLLKPTIDNDIENLKKKYGKEQIDMLKRIFNIMDLRYRDSASLIKSIKSSIVKDLKNNPK
jgi:hypothetical protein